MNKTSEIKVMVTPETKRKFKEKAEEAELSLTAFIEKIAREPLIFLDKNSLTLLKALGKV